jgi:hypothetical protein
MNEQPRKSRVGGARLLKLAWVRVVGWGSSISNLVYLVVNGLRQRFGAWWKTQGHIAITKGLARLAALVILCVMALGVVNYTYRIYSFRQPLVEPYFEQQIGLDLDSVLPDTMPEGKQEDPVTVSDQSSDRLTLGPSLEQLFPVANELPDQGLEVIAASIGAREQLSAEVDRTIFQAPVNPANNMIWPTQGQVSVGYGWVRHPVYRDWRFHPGIEISTPFNATVLAVMDGQVQQIQSERVQGLVVVLKHGDGWETVYRGLSQLRIREGETIKRGQIIGIVGAGDDSQHGRLLFEIRQGNTPLEPRMYLP